MMMNAAPKSDKPPSYYFAYGSLLAKEEIAKTAPGAIPVAIGFLQNHRLKFNKHSQKWGGDAANIVYEPNSVVWGYVYRVNDEERRQLIRRERGYDLVEDLIVVVTKQPGQQSIHLKAFSFQATTCCPDDCGPASAYVQTIVNGARERQLPEAYIKTIATLDPSFTTSTQERFGSHMESSGVTNKSAQTEEGRNKQK